MRYAGWTDGMWNVGCRRGREWEGWVWGPDCDGCADPGKRLLPSPIDTARAPRWRHCRVNNPPSTASTRSTGHLDCAQVGCQGDAARIRAVSAKV